MNAADPSRPIHTWRCEVGGGSRRDGRRTQKRPLACVRACVRRVVRVGAARPASAPARSRFKECVWDGGSAQPLGSVMPSLVTLWLGHWLTQWQALREGFCDAGALCGGQVWPCAGRGAATDRIRPSSAGEAETEVLCLAAAVSVATAATAVAKSVPGNWPLVPGHRSHDALASGYVRTSIDRFCRLGTGILCTKGVLSVVTTRDPC